MNKDSYNDMLAAVQRFHEKHRFRETGGEDMLYRVVLMTEELGEIAESVTKGHSTDAMAEELADLLILVIGSGIALGVDLNTAFWEKLAKINTRPARTIEGRVRVSDFRSPR